MSKWDELEKAAKAATGGDWHQGTDSRQIEAGDGTIICHVSGSGFNDGTLNDSAFIASANPKAVLSLIEQNRELAQRLREALNQMTMAAESIGEGRYDEALLHCGSLHRPKLEAIRKATGEE